MSPRALASFIGALTWLVVLLSLGVAPWFVLLTGAIIGACLYAITREV